METLTTDIIPPRKGTKQEKLVVLLCRKTGATLEQISERLGWQRHTSSAAMTGLKKRGYKIERVSEGGKTSRYIIRAPVTT
ncbi:MAG: hypothetical protein COC03_02755 [Robiginitomaculum sp.]|nr:MAG: hypothetical protein COC03_02755 [Robiginitomaculum sp.]PHQ67537.1 MAG: hypothetical protein COB92_04110 [Robiginitomaculum sp.]